MSEEADIKDKEAKDNKEANEIAMQDEQLKLIEMEQKQNPLVSDRLPIDILMIEYDATENPIYHEKAKALCSRYTDIRKIRGDGNCCYRAVLVSIIEIAMKNNEKAEKFLTLVKNWKKRLIDLGFPDWTTTDFCDYFVEWFEKLTKKTTKLDEVLEELNDDSHSNYLIIFMRLITSGYIKEHPTDYSPFIEDGRSVEEYCAAEIEPMWKYTDHLGITALGMATGFSFRIEYMDIGSSPSGRCVYDLPDGIETPDITLLYRPGHYDVIYSGSNDISK